MFVTNGGSWRETLESVPVEHGLFVTEETTGRRLPLVLGDIAALDMGSVQCMVAVGSMARECDRLTTDANIGYWLKCSREDVRPAATRPVER
jgi:hypothetical protein